MEEVLYEGTESPILLEFDEPTTEMVVHLFNKSKNAIVGKFSYPARDGYVTAVKYVDNYTIQLGREMTLGMAGQPLRMDFWAKVNDTFLPTWSKYVMVVEDTTTKNITPVVQWTEQSE